MAFYFDLGYGKAMELYSNTKLEPVENSTYNPYSGVAFTCTSGAVSYFPNLDFTFEPTAGQFYKKCSLLSFPFILTEAVFILDLPMPLTLSPLLI